MKQISKFIKIIINMYIHKCTANWMAQKSPLRNHIEVVRESSVLRYIKTATKFGYKNPTENGKFLSVIFSGYLL